MLRQVLIAFRRLAWGYVDLAAVWAKVSYVLPAQMQGVLGSSSHVVQHVEQGAHEQVASDQFKKPA